MIGVPFSRSAHVPNCEGEASWTVRLEDLQRPRQVGHEGTHEAHLIT